MKGNAGKATLHITIALVAGIAVGLIFYYIQQNNYSEFLDKVVINGFFAVIGGMFSNAIRLMVVPLVFVSITLGAASMVDLRKFGRVGLKTVGFYTGTTIIALIIAIIISLVVQPGAGFDMATAGVDTATYIPPEPVSFTETITNIVPTNPFQALVEGNMLQIIFLGIFTGITMAILGDKVKTLRKILDELEELIILIVTLIMKTAPYGVFALLVVTFSSLGGDVIFSLISYVACVMGGCIIQLFIVYSILLIIFGKVNPIKFFKKMVPIWAVAFSTSSSSATLPVTMEVAEEEMGVDNQIASLTLPLGATINMDATAIMQATAIIFTAQAVGMDMALADLILIVVVCTLASIGTAGVPSAGIVVLAMIFPMFGLPVEMLAIILSVDRLIDMFRTVVNVSGDVACSICIAKSEDNFNKDIFDRQKTLESPSLSTI